jgi:hypothetical protein
MADQLTIRDTALWLEAIARADGPDVPLWLVGPPTGGATPTMVPCTALRLTRTAGTPALLLLGAGVEIGDPADRHDTCDDPPGPPSRDWGAAEDGENELTQHASPAGARGVETTLASPCPACNEPAPHHVTGCRYAPTTEERCVAQEVDHAAFLAAMQRHAAHPVHIELDLTTCLVLTGALQLALRHPAFPHTSRAICEEYLGEMQAQLAELEPILSHGVAWGNDPAHDVPVEALGLEERRSNAASTGA